MVRWPGLDLTSLPVPRLFQGEHLEDIVIDLSTEHQILGLDKDAVMLRATQALAVRVSRLAPTQRPSGEGCSENSAWVRGQTIVVGPSPVMEWFTEPPAESPQVCLGFQYYSSLAYEAL